MTFLTANLSIFTPYILLLLGGVLSLFVWIERKNKKLSFDITSMALLFSVVFTISYLNIISNSSYKLSGYLFNNIAISYIFLLSLLLFLTQKELIDKDIKFGEYITLFVLAIISSSALILSDNLFTIFLLIEMLSITLYALTGFDKSELSIEASIKYIIVGSFATLFFILGLVFLKLSNTSLELLDLSKTSTSFSLTLAGIFFIAGIFFKIALFPMHSWSVDIYCGSPTYITTALVSFIKFSLLVLAYRIYSVFSPHIPWQITHLVIMLTIAVPTISALNSNNIKKILVYSGISHAGYASIGFMTKSNPYLYFYAFVYSFTAAGAFLTLNLIEKKTNSTDISSLKDIWEREPYLIMMMSIFLFSLAGVPPFAGFFAKFYVFYLAVETSNIHLAIVGAVFSAVAAYYYIKILIPIFTPSKLKPDTFIIKSHPYTFLVLFIILLASIFIGIFSSPIIDLIAKTI